MIFSNKESLEDKLVRLLLGGSHTVKSIRKLLQGEGVPTTLQGIYRVLHILVDEEIVIKHSFTYSLNKEWQSKVSCNFGETKNPLDLAEGETIRMDLASLIHLDKQWKNIMIPLHETYPDYPMFVYNPHDIWKHLSPSRRVSEQEYYDTFNTNQTNLFFVLGGNTPHEQDTKKLRQSNYIQVFTGKEHFKSTDHPVIFGDYIITARLSQSTAQKVTKVFKTAQNEAELDQMIPSIEIEKKKVKLIIERNKEKAKTFRRKIAADFYVPRELVEKFDLF